MSVPLLDRVNRLAAIVESSEDAIIGKDIEGIITDWNRGAQQLYGYTAGEVIGKPVSLLMPSDHSHEFTEIMQKVRRGESISHSETIRLKKDGSRVDISLSVSPIRDRSGKIIGASAIARDISERKRHDAALRESEERFRLLADATPALIWISDTDKLCTYFNMQWLEFTGRPLASELGNGWAEGVHEEDLQRCLSVYVQAFDRREKFRMEYRLRRFDGEYRWVLDIGMPRFNQDASFLGYIGIGIDVTDHRRAEEGLSTVSLRLIQAQEQERARIARELHDDAGQRLALLANDIEQLKNDVLRAADVLRGLDELKEMTLEISHDLQALSHELHSSRLESLGIVPAMRSFCQEFGKQKKMETEFEDQDLPSYVPPDISLCLFRVLQEALHNAAKHSGERYFRVLLRQASGQIHLTVSDSGAGFDPVQAMKGYGLGLTSMKERLHLVNGELSIDSQPRRGTTIRARVPLNSESEATQAG